MRKVLHANGDMSRVFNDRGEVRLRQSHAAYSARRQRDGSGRMA